MNQADDIQAFAAACGVSLPLRLHVMNRETGQTDNVVVRRPFVLIGSSELADVRLIHPDVSRHHAYLQGLGERILCCDLDSRSGTHQEIAIRTPTWLNPGDVFRIGPYAIRLHEPEADDVWLSEGMSLAIPQESGAQSPNLELTLLNARSRSGRKKVSRVRNLVTLAGWSPICNLRLQHRSIGRVHCSLISTRSGLWVLDLQGQKGVAVNDRTVGWARLDQDDELSLGRFRFKFASGAESAQGAAHSEGPDSSSSDGLSAQSDEELSLEESSTSSESQLVRLVDPSSRNANRSLSRGVPPPDLSKLREPPPVIAPLAPGASEVSSVTMNEALMASMMQQFAQMQQQMFEHTHQVLAVVTETFQSAHNRQLQLIREELVRVHELNRELTDLQRQKEAAPLVAAPQAALPAAAAEPVSVPMRLDYQASVGDAAAPPSAEPAAMPGERYIAPPSETSKLAVASTASNPVADIAEEPPQPAGTSPGKQPLPSRSRTRQSPRREKAGAAKGAAPGSEEPAPHDMHAWISGRINELTQERSSRWQRILQLLSSGG